VREKFHKILKVATRTKSRRDRGSEEFERNMRLELPHNYLARSIENLNGWLKFSEGELSILRGPLDPMDQRKS
jgi:hypothetical protein